MLREKRLLLMLTATTLLSIILTSCYHKRTFKASTHADTIEYSEKQLDSLQFAHTHHYSQNFNFIIKSDSIILLKEQPEEFLSGLPTDTVCLRYGERVAVADIRILPSDPVDSVWVQIARDQYTFGWSREKSLLPHVVPDDPISEFISIFSDTHLIITLIITSIISAMYLLRKLFKRNAKIVLFNDISSFYPTLLILVVATSATFYASMQLFAADKWHNFYFHPTLNPFSVSPLLAIFLSSVWSMLIISIAAIDEVRRTLPFGEAILYLCGLCGICALCYIIFSITTLYYIGYPLLAAFYYYAFRQYFYHTITPFVCGKCGARMHKKGICPVCGAINE
ncbi:zinc ribbon domain-containing protein [Prevotella sp.]|uniref:zinc ribbon domain-containing protein n=1 Tax=Prevotella sp. TaxID=59823 RepID=UPI00307D066E